MKQFTFEDLRQIIRDCTGEDEQLSQEGGDVLDLTFEELGYDSVALIETTSRIARAFHVELPDEEMADIATPREYLSFVNRHLTEKV
jgi:act minimal PKS acyl carrier protein